MVGKVPVVIMLVGWAVAAPAWAQDSASVVVRVLRDTVALGGVAVLNGLVLLTTLERRRVSGAIPAEAALAGSRERLRPVLMTALVASIGFLPVALSHGVGAEVQRPLATVVIGGLGTSTLLTLLVLPTLYVWLARRRETPVDAPEAA